MRQNYPKGNSYSLITNGSGEYTTIQNVSTDILISIQDTNTAPTGEVGFFLERFGILRVESSKYIFVKNLEDYNVELEVV